MSIRNLQLNWLRTFEAAGRNLSFSLAAKELNMSQSAVSQQIRLLEHKLGKDLFKREIRAVQLTVEGLAYLEVVQDGLDRLNMGVGNIFNSVAEGVLDLSSNNTFAEFWLAPRIGRFYAQHPQLSVRIFQTNWSRDYPNSNAELEIRYGNGVWPGFSAQRLLPQVIRPYCSIKMASRLRTADGFLRVPLIDVLGTPNGWPDWHRQYVRGEAGSVRRLTVDSYAIAANMAIENVGVCLLNSEFVKDSRLEPLLVSPLDAPLSCDSGYYLAQKTDKPLSGPATAFNQWIEIELAQAALKAAA